MDLAHLKPYKGSKKKRTRVGRGESSGLGKTSGKGSKGQKSRSGGLKRPGFEGGQTPIYRQLPKIRGFKAFTKKDYVAVNLNILSKIDVEKIDLTILKSYKVVPKGTKKIKILASGQLEKKVHVIADIFSKKAAEMIKKAGGVAEVINGQ